MPVPLVLISLLFGIFYLTAAIIYLMIEIGLAAERANKRRRAKAHMKRLSMHLGSGTLGSSIPTVCSGSGNIGLHDRWESDSEGDTVSTTSTRDGGTLPRDGFQSVFYENHQAVSPTGYHDSATLTVAPRPRPRPSTQHPQPPCIPLPQIPSPTVETETPAGPDMPDRPAPRANEGGTREQPPREPEQDPMPPPHPAVEVIDLDDGDERPPVEFEIGVYGDCGVGGGEDGGDSDGFYYN
ncbi:hypothetical protein SB87_gp114 [Parapoxvirus red deer/HL953]|uniref:Uncharacterized protein n=1 Tax=Parapoxvirus red deer/HL953 TaxID=1579460 RepID=A0A0A7MC76_9POXV|nr:hypothetical protein SB87_gp114 [Parapoxvirus red deer/HL953]AIZ77367.1 hypothetical protein [Parapoxvirus red deer/HL953]